MQDNKKIDGYVSFIGGMDTSRSPSLLAENQYVLSVNMVIQKSKEGIATRAGWRNIEIEFDRPFTKDIFENGNPQGCGWFFDGLNIIQLFSISGYIIELRKKNNYIKSARILNRDFQNNPNIRNVYITRVPLGAIINDGESSAIYTNGTDTIRTSFKKKQIGSGLMGAYIQNRFFYVLPNRKEIYASTINDPISLEEAYIDNIYGFRVPEDNEFITAIGKQGTIAKDAVGGNLAFSTDTDFYSVDVRGARKSWGALAGYGVGFVNNTLPGLGAVSGYSFESFNGNVFYRNNIFGFVNLNQGRSEFQNRDSFTNHTIEASLFFDTDHEEFLNRCYTVGYKKSLYTTVSPFHKDGFVYWNGIIVKTPDPYYGKEENAPTNIIESVFTGIRPWSLLVTSNENRQEMFCLSYDFDGKNRLYFYDHNINHDIGSGNKIIDIESKLITRFLSFKNPMFQKIGSRQFYSLSNISRDTELKILTRISEKSNFEQQWCCEHKINTHCIMNGKLSFESNKQDRDHINFSSDPKNQGRYFIKQDYIKMKGSASIVRLIRQSDIVDFDSTVYKCSNEDNNKHESFHGIKIFDYKISQ